MSVGRGLWFDGGFQGDEVESEHNQKKISLIWTFDFCILSTSTNKLEAVKLWKQKIVSMGPSKTFQGLAHF